MDESVSENIDKHITNSRIKVKVKPGSKTSEILGFEKDVLVVKVKAQPEKGRANEELITLLKKQLKKRAHIVSGAASRKKIVEFY
jgi:uncharacterized protein (TIGR00251 family)